MPGGCQEAQRLNTEIECHPSHLPTISTQESLLTSQNLFPLMTLWVQIGSYLISEMGVQRNNTWEGCRKLPGTCVAPGKRQLVLSDGKSFMRFCSLPFSQQGRVCFLFISLFPAFGLFYSISGAANNHACQQYITYGT